MSLQQLPEKAKNSDLIKILKSKLKIPQGVAFDYEGQLVRIADRTTAEVGQINRLFPEYTPHDAHYHINRLFEVADHVITSSCYEELNVAELFVLAAALYGHDWGMAVSDKEKEAIKALWSSEGKSLNESILPNEYALTLEFSAKIGTPSIR